MPKKWIINKRKPINAVEIAERIVGDLGVKNKVAPSRVRAFENSMMADTARSVIDSLSNLGISAWTVQDPYNPLLRHVYFVEDRHE
jgi:hypothetical protein